MLLAGDLEPQDGTVNSYDTALIYNNLGKQDSSTLQSADVNLDGVVDSQDYSLVLTNSVDRQGRRTINWRSEHSHHINKTQGNLRQIYHHSRDVFHDIYYLWSGESLRLLPPKRKSVRDVGQAKGKRSIENIYQGQ